MNILKKLTGRPWPNCLKTINANRVLFVVLLVFIPLYPKFPLQKVGGTYVSVRLEDWLVFASVLVWVISQAKRGFPVSKEKITLFFLFYWAAGLISLLAAIFITGLPSGKLGFFHLVRRIEYMSLFFIAYDAAATLGRRRPFKIIVFTSLAVFGYGIGQKYFGWPIISTMNEEFSKGIVLHLSTWTRISSTFAGHYDLAVWLSLILVFMPALFVTAKNKWQKLFLATAFFLNFYLLVLTASRVSFVAYLIGISFTLLLLKKPFWLFFILGFSLAFGLRSHELNARLQGSFPPLASIRLPFKRGQQFPLTPTPAAVSSPAKTIARNGKKIAKKTLISAGSKPEAEKGKERKVIVREVRTWPTPEEVKAAAARSSRIRFEVEWPRAVGAFWVNPILGTGFSSLGLATDNDYLRVLGETGLLGGLAFFLIIFHLFSANLIAIVKKTGPEKFLAAGMIGCLMAFLANAVFIDVFEASKAAFYFWIWMGIGYHLKVKNQKSKVR